MREEVPELEDLVEECGVCAEREKDNTHEFISRCGMEFEHGTHRGRRRVRPRRSSSAAGASLLREVDASSSKV